MQQNKKHQYPWDFAQITAANTPENQQAAKLP